MKRIAIRTACIVLSVWVGVFSASEIRYPLQVALLGTLGVLFSVFLLSTIGKALKRYQREKRRN